METFFFSYQGWPAREMCLSQCPAAIGVWSMNGARVEYWDEHHWIVTNPGVNEVVCTGTGV